MVTVMKNSFKKELLSPALPTGERHSLMACVKAKNDSREEAKR